MKFLFKYPTRGRPEQFKQTFHKWQDMLSGKHEYTFLIAMDSDDNAAVNQPLETCCYARFDFIVKPHKSKVEAVNSGIKDYDFDILVVISDDMIPIVFSYDIIIADAMQKYYPDLDGALNFFDGLHSNPECCTLTIMGKKLYARFGYVYHPSYLGTHCDNEYTDECRRMNKIVWFGECIIEHKWKGVHDATSERDQQNFQIDKENYERRKRTLDRQSDG